MTLPTYDLINKKKFSKAQYYLSFFVASAFRRNFFVPINSFFGNIDCWTCSFERKISEKKEKITKNKARQWGISNEKKSGKTIFLFKFSPLKTKNKSHSLCATIMTLYNIVTITTYITIRMSHIPIHHQNLVWKKCSI